MPEKRRYKIFTNHQLDIMERRLQGDKRDPTRTFAKEVKPKIEELFFWFRHRAWLRKVYNTIQKKYQNKHTFENTPNGDGQEG